MAEPYVVEWIEQRSTHTLKETILFNFFTFQRLKGATPFSVEPDGFSHPITCMGDAHGCKLNFVHVTHSAQQYTSLEMAMALPQAKRARGKPFS